MPPYPVRQKRRNNKLGFSRAGFLVGTARDVRAVPACRFSTCCLGTYSKTRTKTNNILVETRNLLEKSLLSSFHNTFFSKNAAEGTVSPLNQDTKQNFEFEFALHV